MPTALPRRLPPRTNRRMEIALALAILMEGIALTDVVAHGVMAKVATSPIALDERAVAQALDAMLSP